MWRLLAGGASTLLLSGAGLFWWTSGSDRASPVPAFNPGQAQAAVSQSQEAAPPEAEERTREQKRFDRYDKDRNDAISREEYLASRRKAFAKLDTNGDGRLSFEEWAKKTTDKFAKADADGSAALSRAEFATTRVVRKARPRCDCPAPPPREEDDEN